MAEELPLIKPDWPAPEKVKALSTTRLCGVSQSPYESFNLGLHVGDDSGAVEHNRQRLQKILATPYGPQWLQQVHGSDVIEANVTGEVRQADASFTSEMGVPCAVMTADCLPVLVCAKDGSQVAAAHAGWRGLANGVLEAVLGRMNSPASELLVWLGPAIGPKQFEVGVEVRDAFLSFSDECAKPFVENELKPNHWFADIYQLARIRLRAFGVEELYGGGFCTYSEPQRFFSYRRDGQTGRMASLIWLAD